MAITTATAYKAAYPSTLADSVITRLIAVAQNYIELWTSRKFDQATYTQVDSGDEGPAIVLRNRPIVSVTSVSIIGDDNEASVVDATAYRYDPDTGTLSYLDDRNGRLLTSEYATRSQTTWGFVSGFPRRFRNVSTVYVGGYLEAAMPPALVELVNEMVGTMITSGAGVKAVAPQLQSETFGSYAYTRVPKPIRMEHQKIAVSLWGTYR